MSFRLNSSFASSGTALGVIDNGISYFLLIFYSQVVGLSPALTGLALMIALCVDAITDPIVGRWSDRLQHNLGRRHPFLYASLIPIAVAYYLLWVPPETEHLFWYLLTLIILLRLGMTLHIVPFYALIPEVTPEYHERTKLANYSYSASWLIGTLAAVAMYGVWLADTPDYPDGAGVLRRDGYREAAIVTTLLITACLLYATVITTRLGRELPQRTPKVSPAADWFRDIWQTLQDRDLFVLICTGFLIAVASGTGAALWAYMQPYYWHFDNLQISGLLAAQLLSAPIAFFAINQLVTKHDKKKSLMAAAVLMAVNTVSPILLNELGWFPGEDSSLRYPIMLAQGVIQVAMIVITSTLFMSMLSDSVEARAVVTGRREEGLLISMQSFVAKVATGMGIWASGLTLTLINFPSGITVELSNQTQSQLGLAYALILAIGAIGAICVISFYSLTESQHKTNLEGVSA